MNIEAFQLLIDAGLVVLIWLVQLCIYPAFTFFKEENLIKWHEAYTPRITSVVLPLMLSQLILALFMVYNNLEVRNIINIILVLTTWASTFMIFVPLHQKIALKDEPHNTSLKLVRLNWIRVALWNLILITNSLFFIFS